MNKGDLNKIIAKPGAERRGKPFWAWNGELCADEICRQVNIMNEMGFGGFFMNSRAGLATEYLGSEWMDMVEAAADEAEKLGMEAWLYDERGGTCYGGFPLLYEVACNDGASAKNV